MILIEKDKALEHVSYDEEWAVECINALPTIEIVRCGECKHHDGIRCFRWNSTIITGVYDFCSRRREEERE